MVEDNKITVNENFFNEDSIFDDKQEVSFDAPELLELKKEMQEVEGEREEKVEELISYDTIKKNLSYKLPYQTEGALKIIRDMNTHALLADEVGLGKTITTGLVIKESVVRGFVKKILILTPPSLVDQWVAELKEKFELDFKIVESANDWVGAKFLIASLDRVKIFDNNKRQFKHSLAHEVDWDLVIVDEAHKLKERNTVRWRFVDLLKKKRFLLLTATPFQNDLLELYNLLNLLKKGHLGTVKEFRNKFLYKGNKRYPLNPLELRRKLGELMLRRKRSETGIDYKPRVPKIISVKLTKEEKIIYDNICDLIKSKYFMASGNQINGLLAVYAILPKITSSSKSAIESLDRIANSEEYHGETRDFARGILEDYAKLKVDSKIETLVGLVKEIRARSSDEKILIYTRHPTTLRYIVETLAPMNLKIVEFMGGLDREEKTRRINEFKSGNADILISTDTGAEGLNFQFCRNLINYDLPWNPMSVEQRIGRLDRIGQKREIFIYSLATADTMEEYVVDLIINKMCCVGLVIGELPIILFNLGLDGEGEYGRNKIEEKLMMSFIDSKNNLDIFANEVSQISRIVDAGIREYREMEKMNKVVLDGEK
ncbi:DEAD/DEAH box helicase [Candidatus Pacearchaeota archaeon]|nr:DEAD/DEAH box helicase [Candidatus Pacearchaeota archaeon]